MTKICSKCSLDLPLGKFHKQKNGKHGVRSHCKECQSKIKKQYLKRIVMSNVNRNHKYYSALEKECKTCCKLKCGLDFSINAHTKDGLSYDCKVCINITKRDYYSKNTEKEINRVVGYHNRNKDKVLEYRSKNQDKINARSKAHYKKNKDRYRKKHKEWKENNIDKVRSYDAKRRAAKLQRIPAWTDQEITGQVYADCEEINLAAATAGCTEKFVVDHIIPLLGTNVSGLHISSNLQIITAKENGEKHNKFNSKLGV